MVDIPLPVTLIEITWFFIGLSFARGFAKNLDQTVQKSEWFMNKRPIIQWFTERLLDSLHHYWMGLLFMVYSNGMVELYWLGVGIFVDDIPDIPRRYKKLFKQLPI